MYKFIKFYNPYDKEEKLIPVANDEQSEKAVKYCKEEIKKCRSHASIFQKIKARFTKEKIIKKITLAPDNADLEFSIETIKGIIFTEYGKTNTDCFTANDMFLEYNINVRDLCTIIESFPCDTYDGIMEQVRELVVIAFGEYISDNNRQDLEKVFPEAKKYYEYRKGCANDD